MPKADHNGGEKTEDLSVTALYTSQVWRWGKLPEADLFDTPEARVIFRITNAALWFAKLFIWRLKSLKHGLLHRHTLIDEVVRRSKPSQVLELAAGLSRRGSSFSGDPTIDYTEVDLPHVVEKKRGLLEAHERGRTITARPNFRLIAADVAELNIAERVDQNAPTVIIAEGLLMYLQPNEQRALWGKIADALGPAGTFVFDHVPWVEQPKPGPVGRAMEWVMKRFTGGKSFERDLRTRDDLTSDLKGLGFGTVELYEPCVVAHEWGLPYPDKSTQQLVFVCRRS